MKSERFSNGRSWTIARHDRDPEDDPSHYMMPDVHGNNVVSLYQPGDLEDPREPREAMFQQFEAFGNAMTASTTAATGSYGWRGQEGSESEFVDTPEASTPAQTSPNLVLMQARHYDPTIGRFLQADPLKMSSFTTQGLNRYIYCNNDPVNCSDPSGNSLMAALFWIAVVFAVLALLVKGYTWVSLFGALAQQPACDYDEDRFVKTCSIDEIIETVPVMLPPNTSITGRSGVPTTESGAFSWYLNKVWSLDLELDVDQSNVRWRNQRRL